MENVDLYIFSSIKGPGRRDGRYIFVLEAMTGKGPVTLTGGPREVTEMTAYQSELRAINEGLKRLRKPCSLKIHVSNVTLRAALQNEWFRNWDANDYRNSKGEEISCAEEWKAFVEYLGENNITDVVSDRHSYSSWMESECTGKENKHV
jgi:ribonuclease HI